MAEDKHLNELLSRHGDRVRAILNILIESPYFYETDDPEKSLFPFLLRHKREFTAFFKDFYDWDLIFDQLPKAKCARVFKPKWYNTAISESRRQWFRFTRRDECLAFMILLEFFEQQLEEQNMSIEDPDNLHFYAGDLLAYECRRLGELYPDKAETYSMDNVRKLLRDVLAELEKFRMLARLKPHPGEQISDDQVIYEALPALYHYNPTRLSYQVLDSASDQNVVATANLDADMNEIDNEDMDHDER